MRHEDFLIRLTLGYAEAIGYSYPEDTGSNEADAVARWLAWHVANHADKNCFIELDTLYIPKCRTWRRWQSSSREEDTDMMLSGPREGSIVQHSIKILVRPVVGSGQLTLQITDWTLQGIQWQFNGRIIRESNGRIFIGDLAQRRRRERNLDIQQWWPNGVPS